MNPIRLLMLFVVINAELMTAHGQPLAPAAEMHSIPACAEEGEVKAQKRKRHAEVTYFVGVSYATMRKDASTSAAVLGYLPIGTPLTLACQENGWLRVWASGFKGLIGWVRADLVQAKEPTMSDLMEEYRNSPASDVAKRRQIAERAVAFDPLDENALSLLIDTLTTANDPKALARAKAKLNALQHPTVEKRAGEPDVIFVVDGSMMTPLATLKDGKLAAYPEQDDSQQNNDEAIDAFSKKYFESTRPYNFYTRGGKAGVGFVYRKEEPSCSSIVASVKLPKMADGSAGNGILTNFELSDRTPDAARPVTTEQRKIMRNLATGILKRNEVPRKDMEKLFEDPSTSEGRTQQSFGAIEVAGSDLPILVATYNVELMGEDPDRNVHGYVLVLIAEAGKEGKYHVTYTDFAKSEGEQEYGPLSYLDHMDINRDGKEELIFMGSGYEWWWYKALGKENGKWKELVAGGGGGC